MNPPFTVRIRFCGGCNPEIDRGETVKQVLELLGGRAQATYEPTAPADVVLCVSGCAHACLDEEKDTPAGPEPVVSIQGSRVNRKSVSPKELAGRAAEALLRAAGQDAE